MKPIDKAILGMVSESPGRNGSEPRVASTRMNPEAEPLDPGRRQHGMAQSDRSVMFTPAGW